MQMEMDKRTRRREIIDHVMTNQDYMKAIESTEIDEEKQYKLHKKECQNKQLQRKHTHNAILINVDFISPKDVSRKKIK